MPNSILRADCPATARTGNGSNPMLWVIHADGNPARSYDSITETTSCADVWSLVGTIMPMFTEAPSVKALLA